MKTFRDLDGENAHWLVTDFFLGGNYGQGGEELYNHRHVCLLSPGQIETT